MLVINILGGPGTGKSTLLSGLFYELKIQGIICDVIPEVAKKLTYEKRYDILKNRQMYIFSEQLNELRTLDDNKIDLVITDGSLINSIVYSKEDNPHFNDLVLYEFNKYENLTYYLKRETNYQTSGRRQDINGALKVDEQTLNTFEKFNIDYKEVGLKNSKDIILKDILKNFL